MRPQVSLRVIGALVAVVALCAACDPGWTNPVLGTGDGSGTTPGSVAVASDQVALGEPDGMVDLGTRGYLVYDFDNCTILQVKDRAATRYAGTGTCGYSGDGGPATEATINVVGMPVQAGMTADPDGNVYFMSREEPGTPRVRRIDAATGTISTVPEISGQFIFGLSAEANGQVTYLTVGEADATNDWVRQWRLERYDGAGNVTLLASLDEPANSSTPVGLARLGADNYITMGYANGENLLVEFDHGQVATTPVPATSATCGTQLIPQAAANGVVYGVVYDDQTLSMGNTIFKLDVANAGTAGASAIASSSTGDDGTVRQYGQAASLDLSPNAIALTRNGNMLISSGHTVYAMHDYAAAPAFSGVGCSIAGA